MGPQRAKLVREPFGQHRDGAVHEVDRRAALFGFGVDRRAGAHVVRNVGDVDADLPDAVSQPAHRQGVVEVLRIRRVHREGRDGAEVAPFGVVPLRDAAVDRGGGLLHFGLEAVGKVVFGQYRVHLRVVLARRAEDFDQLARRAFAARSPIRDAYGDLLAVLHVGVLPLGEVDVHRHLARVAPHEDLMLAHLGHAHIGSAAAFDDADDLPFGRAAPSRAGDDHLHRVAVEGVDRIALVDEDVLLQLRHPHVDRSARSHVGRARVAGKVPRREAELLAPRRFGDPLREQFFDDPARFAAPLLGGAARGRGEVLERELAVGELAEEFYDSGFAVDLALLFRSVRPFGFRVVFSCHDFEICRARSVMNPMPLSIAPSSGLNSAVWVRPAAAPTPSR